MTKKEALEQLENKNKNVGFWLGVVKQTDSLDPNYKVFSTVFRNVCFEFSRKYDEVKGFLCL